MTSIIQPFSTHYLIGLIEHEMQLRLGNQQTDQTVKAADKARGLSQAGFSMAVLGDSVDSSIIIIGRPKGACGYAVGKAKRVIVRSQKTFPGRQQPTKRAGRGEIEEEESCSARLESCQEPSATYIRTTGLQ
ncbi:MAG: hypothetical protein ACYSTF_08335 [Planctomycetota bacterium]